MLAGSLPRQLNLSICLLQLIRFDIITPLAAQCQFHPARVAEMTMATLTGRHDKPRFKQTLFEISNLYWHERTIIHSKDFYKKKVTL